MNISRLICGATLITLGGCNATMPTGAEIEKANSFLAQNAWGGANAGARRSSSQSQSAASRKTIVRNESHDAIAGVPVQVGVRWAIDKDCSPKSFTVRIAQQPRYGRVSIKPVNYTVPTSSVNSGTQKTLRLCSGRPTVGQAIIYQSPEGSGNYYDNFAVETSTGLRFNYRILVKKPVG